MRIAIYHIHQHSKISLLLASVSILACSRGLSLNWASECPPPPPFIASAASTTLPKTRVQNRRRRRRGSPVRHSPELWATTGERSWRDFLEIGRFLPSECQCFAPFHVRFTSFVQNPLSRKKPSRNYSTRKALSIERLAYYGATRGRGDWTDGRTDDAYCPIIPKIAATLGFLVRFRFSTSQNAIHITPY